jgi:hypothetical protein
MTVTMTATGDVVDVDGCPCRIWEGRTERGTPVVVLVAMIGSEPEHEDELRRELLPQDAVRVQLTLIDGPRVRVH